MPNKSRLKCYFGCAHDQPLHKFPNPLTTKLEDIEKFQIWKTVLDKSIQDKGDVYIFNSVRICHKHFIDCYTIRGQRLTRNAIPTLFLEPPQNEPATAPVTAHAMDTVPDNVLGVPVVITTSALGNISDVLPTTQPSTSRCHKTCIASKYQEGSTSQKRQPQVVKLLKRLKKLSDKNKMLTKKIRLAEKLSLKKSYLKIFEKLPKDIQTFTSLQLKYSKKPRGRRYTVEEKIMALTIFKQSPKAYNLLKRMFVLPSKRSVQQVLNAFSLRPGINKHMLANLKNAVEKMTAEKKLVTLLFDEVSLAPGVVYHSKSDKIIGFEDFGSKRTKTLADHALVLMIKGIKSKYKQPICFTFCRSATKKNDLKYLIINVIEELHSIGLRVVATICDQATTNVAVIKSLQEDTRAKYLLQGIETYSRCFELSNYKIFPLFDTPHLLKGVRNNLLTKNATYVHNGTTKCAKWDHLKLLLNIDEGDSEIRLVNKLTESHVMIDKIPKMKVKHAAQVFSQRVSSALRFLARHKVLPAECEQTADFLLMFDKLFDSFNGHSYQDAAKPYKSCLKNNSPHFQLWNDLLSILESIKFESVIKKNNTVSIKHDSIPSIKNWIHNIKVFREMWVYLNQNRNVNNLLTRNFNQDPLENFFSSIRCNGVRNINPNCYQFMNAFKTLIINNFNSSHSAGANCEQDSNQSYQSLVNLICENSDDSHNDDFACEINSILNLMHEIRTTDSLLHVESKKYVTGYVIKKCKSKIFKKCSACSRDLCRSTIDMESFNYEIDYTKKTLFHPSDGFIDLMNDIYFMIVACLRDSPDSMFLKKKIKFLINCM